MTTPDFRALCAELVGYIERATHHYFEDPELMIRARAAINTAPSSAADPRAPPAPEPEEHRISPAAAQQSP
jgi:hypothetical protein